MNLSPSPKLLTVRLAVVALATLIITTISSAVAIAGQHSPVLIAALTFTVFGGSTTAYTVASFKALRYTMDDSYLTAERGVLWKKRRITPLNKITNVDVSQGPLERFLNIGHI